MLPLQWGNSPNQSDHPSSSRGKRRKRETNPTINFCCQPDSSYWKDFPWNCQWTKKMHCLHSTETSSVYRTQGRENSTENTACMDKQSGTALYLLTWNSTSDGLQISRWSGSKSKDTLCSIAGVMFQQKAPALPSAAKSRKQFQTS